MTRKPLSKRLRFSIFARDSFTCRYCGRQSDEVKLHVDHVIPVSQGGTNDEENLVTSCADCNLGKAAKTIPQSAITESDRLRIAQEMREQVESADLAVLASNARKKRKEELAAFWRSVTRRTHVDVSTLNVIFRYVTEYGEEVVYHWIEKADEKCNTDSQMGRYISGIRRMTIAEQKEELK